MFKDLTEVIRTIKKECGIEIFSDSERLRNAYYDFGTSLDEKVTFMFELFLKKKGSEIIMDAYKKHGNINIAFKKVELSMNQVLIHSEDVVRDFCDAVYEGMFGQKSAQNLKKEKIVQPEIKKTPEVKEDMNTVVYRVNAINELTGINNSSKIIEKAEKAEKALQTKKTKKKIILSIVAIVLICLAGFGILLKINKYSRGISLNEKEDLLINSEIGEEVYFGTYEQDNNEDNGKEDIEWIVLDKQDGKALVISKYALDSKLYNENLEGITWEDCTLRTWLNNDFINETFNTEEIEMIPVVTVTSDENPVFSIYPGNDTQDQIFLLSIQEADKYFSSYEQRKCKPTEYAINNGVFELDGNCDWWLRSPGSNQDTAAKVYNDGDVSEGGYNVYYDDYGVRPAMWINLE